MHCRLMFSGLVRAFWYSVAQLRKEGIEKNTQGTPDYVNAMDGFRMLARKVLYDYHFCQDKPAALFLYSELMVEVEDTSLGIAKSQAPQ